jgi:hypothetical protein
LGACAVLLDVSGVSETVQWTVSAANGRRPKVKHGFVALTEDWPFSSVHRDGRYVPGMGLGEEGG